MRIVRLTFLPLFCLLAATASAREEAFPPQSLEFFERDVRPLLAAKCFNCHGRGKKLEGGLRLSTRAGLIGGGDSGPAAVPGKPDQSLLVRAVRYDSDLQMPPDGKLKDSEVATLVRWVELGLPWPDEADAASPAKSPGRDLSVITQQQRAHWSFQPVNEHRPPAVRKANWIRTPIDSFILAKLEERGLEPAPPVDKRTLLRRVTFDLVGLPPTPSETADFLADDSPHAFARVVDRLLASVHYGERWGRHWLDVARYADSSGKDENHACSSAFRYRDYVVQALNDDKPFDRFIREQIAGDLLPAASEAERYENLTATGFLQLGPKALAEQDKPKMLMDIVDEQIDAVSKAFLGLTVSCGRCHDHKLEPVPQRDYYALAGIFRSTRSMADLAFVSTWLETPLAGIAVVDRAAAHEKLVKENQQQIDERIRQAQSALQAVMRTDLRYGAKGLFAPPADTRHQYAAADRAALAELESRRDALKASAPPAVPMAMAVSDGEIVDAAINIRGNHLNLGDSVPRGFLQIVPLASAPAVPSSQSGRKELADWIARADHPLTARVIVNRVWQWHFGEGLCRSPDNLGMSGTPSSHPELLDWLARRFVADGWSLKRLHREILLSSTYQMASRANGPAAVGDPENLLQARFNRRRLEAEEFRDALLAVSGQLDPAVGGNLFNYANREPHVGYYKGPVKYDFRRRSLYLPVVRNAMYDLFDLFDHGDALTPLGRRSETTVAPQALYLMNSDVVLAAADALAQRARLAAPTDPVAAIANVYDLAFTRAPSDAERAAGLAFIQNLESLLVEKEPDAPTRQKRAWQVFCQALLVSSEFLTVE